MNKLRTDAIKDLLKEELEQWEHQIEIKCVGVSNSTKKIPKDKHTLLNYALMYQIIFAFQIVLKEQATTRKKFVLEINQWLKSFKKTKLDKLYFANNPELKHDFFCFFHKRIPWGDKKRLFSSHGINLKLENPVEIKFKKFLFLNSKHIQKHFGLGLEIIIDEKHSSIILHKFADKHK